MPTTRANERASDCRRAITNAKRLATLPALVRSLDRLTREARLIRYGLRLVRQVKLGKRLHDVTHVHTRTSAVSALTSSTQRQTSSAY